MVILTTNRPEGTYNKPAAMSPSTCSLFLVCLLVSVHRNLVQGCDSDSQCPYGYHCCTGTDWCCSSGYICTGTATCLSVGIIVGPIVAVVIIIALVVLWCYRRRRATYNQI
ncbi:uncharacterized protein LOC134267200 [Saccostrea cucullata]|uniref:uncharacterized protein LOC134267200 n=1 Tax=Saccostrea cuccullata TaxID=36930 RepID=UPI002ED67782